MTGAFRVPGIRGVALDQVTRENTTLYASDRDMLQFLADEERRNEAPLARRPRPPARRDRVRLGGPKRRCVSISRGVSRVASTAGLASFSGQVHCIPSIGNPLTSTIRAGYTIGRGTPCGSPTRWASRPRAGIRALRHRLARSPDRGGRLGRVEGVVQSGLKPGHVLIGLGGLVTSGALGIGLLLFAWRLVVVGSLTRPIALLSPDGYRRLGVLFVALALVMIAGGLLAPFEDWYMAPICPGMIALACFYIAGALGDT